MSSPDYQGDSFMLGTPALADAFNVWNSLNSNITVLLTNYLIKYIDFQETGVFRRSFTNMFVILVL